MRLEVLEGEAHLITPNLFAVMDQDLFRRFLMLMTRMSSMQVNFLNF